MKRTAVLAWSLTFVSVALLMVGGAIQVATGHGENDGGWIEHVGLLTSFSSFPVIGALVASRHPRNPLGWIFIAVGVTIGMLVTAMEYAYLGLVLEPEAGWPGATLAAWLEQWLWYPANMAIPSVTLLLFPTGRPPSRRWNWLVWVASASVAVISVASMIERRLMGEGYNIDNPVGFAPFNEAESALEPFFFAYVAVVLTCLASLIFRYRASRGEERQQLKLLTYAAVVFVITLIIGNVWDLPDYVFALVVWAIPGAMGVAISKYRLFDVDVVINRTLVYGVLTALLAATYFGSVVFLQRVLDSITLDSDIAVAGSTLLVAALFRPLRSRVQSFIDQRFYRRRYDARATLEQFSSHLREEVDLASLSSQLIGVVQTTMQPTHASLWLRAERPPHAVARADVAEVRR